MNNTIVIFGGAGYIGWQLAQYALQRQLADRVILADIKEPPAHRDPRISYRRTDVRHLIPQDLCSERPSWIFNFAAVHREPGHEAHEYFDTNLSGAHNVCDFAEAVGCNNVYFTSSISVYGPTDGPTEESAPKRPISPYGGSKYPAELIHQIWQARGAGRRLVIVRPGVVYGPNDPGNIGRMVKAVMKGYFAFPGSTDIRKSYAYVYGLLESMEFVMKRSEPLIVYNYVETPTQTLGEIVNDVKRFVGSKAPVLSVPTAVLLPVAHGVQAVFGSRNPVHPVRVRKAGMSTHIVPRWLMDHGFVFRYSFADSLKHWRQVAPEDFALGAPSASAA